jgi:hypothetical protein
MLKKFSVFLFLLGCVSLQFCATSKTAGGRKIAAPAVSYATDIAPIMQARCTPCHFPDGGKKKFLDTHTAVRDNIEDILYRIQLPADSSAFMPWKSKKPPLSDSLIQVIRVWKESGMAG